jgi:hypothetical protein
MSQPHVKTALGEALKSLRVDEETYYDNLLDEARSNIENLEKKNISLQHRYNKLRSIFCNSTYKVSFLADGGYAVTSTAWGTQTKTFADLDEGVAWAEGLFDSTYAEEN